jgi:radical SAM/Cys-rich protein
MKTLLYQRDPLSSSGKQLEILRSSTSERGLFQSKLQERGLYPLRPTGIEIFQINVGKQCNQTCKHCHVDAGPDRKEMMSPETFEQCLDVLRKYEIPTVDVTGGAPEMHPLFRWFVEACTNLKKEVIVRCNLTIILANKKYYDLPEFYKKHNVQVICSLPFYNADRTDKQRGEGVFHKSIEALKMLNAVGYGMEDSDLKLHLVYNPSGAFLPADQFALEKQFKDRLRSDHGIYFNNLFTITNMPISRFLDFLIKSGNLDSYMEKLMLAFNASAAKGVMCRNTISVGWDGSLYDCDFNQMLDLKVDRKAPQHISDFDLGTLNQRDVVINQHCFGCTAGSGSSCGGTTATPC